MSVRTASQFITETLRLAGIDCVFGLPGVHALGLWSALEKSGMPYIGFRHEQAAAHAADGYGRATGRPGVVMLSTGPGALNALSALGEAYVSSSPLLAVTSAIPSHLAGQGKGYLHEAKDLGPAFEAVTEYSEFVASVTEVPEILYRALEAAIGGRPRPALIEIPVDLLDLDLDAEPLAPERSRALPDDNHIVDASMLAGLAARPVIWAGGGAISSGASEELTRLAELLDAPVVTTFMGKGAISEKHPLSVGTLVRQPEVAELLAEADLMIAVGTRFSAMSTGNWKLEVPSQLIHIDIDRSEIGRNYPVRLGIVADAKLALDSLARSLTGKRPPPSEQSSGPLRAQRVREAAFARARAEGPQEIRYLEALRSAIDPEIPIVHDMTIPSYWSWPFLETTVPKMSFAPYGYGSLGFSLPAAIGVAVAGRGRPVVSIAGDGGFQYHSRELATLRQYDLPVTVVVFNDEAWGVLRAFSESRYSSSFGMDIPAPDFLRLAEAHGIPAVRANHPDDLEKALKDSLAQSAPSLIEVPGAWALPPPSTYYR